MMIGWVLVLVLVIAAVWALVRAQSPGRRGPGGDRDEDRAEALVREQYARGEIDEETYRRRLHELRRG